VTGRNAAGEGTPPAQIDPRFYRNVLGHFASGITVITAVSPVGPVGFTCQSFTALSLDPPLVLISPSNASTTWPLIRSAGRFCINVLADGHQEVSAAFAVSGGDKFSSVSWSRTPNGSPVLDDVVAWIDCILYAEHLGGDHSIVVGAVEDMGASSGAQPLLYFRGRYATLGG
jgi:3-hydroxy-9,10-secoandrosta-1,3,5(10)-triene-9,17-dione monooxygenase reductase component